MNTNRQRSVCILVSLMVILIVHVGAPDLRAASTLNFPRLGYDTNTFTGVAFVNPTAAEARITVKAFGPNGSLLQGTAPFRNTVELAIPAFRQTALTISEIFGAPLPPEQFGWMQATSPADGITGFFLYLDGSITLFDGADLPASGRKLIFPRVREGDGYSTELNIINPGTAAAELDMQLYLGGEGPPRANVSSVVIPAKGMVRVSLNTHFGIQQAPDGTFLLVTASNPVGGFGMVRLQGKDLIGLNARPTSEGLDILYFPQMAVLGPWVTHLGLVNLSDEPVIATVSARKSDGSLHRGAVLQGSNPAVLPIPAGGAVYRDVATLFGFSGTDTIDGWLKVEGTRPTLTGFVLYGIPAFGSAAAVASQPEALNRALFSHIATSFGYFTGVALLNPGQVANPYRVMAFNKESGASLGVFEGVLQPGERVSRLITELIPNADNRPGGFIWVKTEQPAYMTSLFGTAPPNPLPPQPKLVLANIPAQPSPAGFAPDASLPSIRVTPPLAVVQPGKTQQFSARDSQGAVKGDARWQVNGIDSGNPQVGTISTAGVYTAPDPVPTALPVTISAQSGTSKGGASVDVLRKEALFQGTGIIQSLTYLRSLKLLYSAEVNALAGSGAVAPQVGPDTEIYSITTASVRTRVRALPGMNIVKMIDFTNTAGREFLLLCDRTGGQILRYDPSQPNVAPVFVAGGFDQPNSMTFDPVTRNLLVADRNQIWSIDRTRLETGIGASGGPSTQGTRTTRIDLLVTGLNEARGVSVDACTGKIYVAEGSGRLLEIDRVSGTRRTVLEFASPGQILGLYRKEVPCPPAFQVLVADGETRRIVLVGPSSEIVVDWLGDSLSREIAYLPVGNEFTGESGILLGESIGTGSQSQAALIPVPGLYVNQQKNVGAPQYGSDFADPLGDIFNPGPGAVDLALVIGGAGEGAEVVWYMELGTPVDPGNLSGFIELDTDRNAATGATSLIDLTSPYSSNLGVEYRIDLSTFAPEIPQDPNFGIVSVRNAVTGAVVGEAFLYVVPQETPGLIVSLFLEPFGITLPLHYAVIIGPEDRPTDVAPNGGFLVPVSFPSQ